MADVHGKRALLNLCDANGLRLYLARLARAARRAQGPRRQLCTEDPRAGSLVSGQLEVLRCPVLFYSK